MMNMRIGGRIITITLAALVFTGSLNVSLRAQDAARPEAGAKPAVADSSPAAATDSQGGKPEELTASPDVDRILRRTEKAGDEVQKLQADFEYHYYKRLIRSQEWRSGKLTFSQPSNFLISFVDGDKQTFRFNGRVFVEDRPLQMQRNVYRLRSKDDPPVDSISINRTPFPLPFGQKRDDVLRNFEVEYRGKEKLQAWRRPDHRDTVTDDREYERLVLTPRKESPLSKEYTRLDFWIDPETGLPKQIRTQDESKAILTVRFGPLSLNEKVEIDDSAFDEPRMPGGDWKRSYEDVTEQRPTTPAGR